MADRYWVGGTGTWNTSSTANWSASSGGPSGASVPTSADNVFFNSASGTGTVTAAAGTTINCLDLSVSSSGLTFISTSNNLSIFGSFSLLTNWTWVGSMTFAATSGARTIASNGFRIATTVTFGPNSSSTASWTLQDDLATTSGSLNNITFRSGTFNSNNFAINCNGFSSTASFVRTINLGSSSVTLNADGGGIGNAILFNAPNLIFNAGTSTITCTGSGSVIFSGAGVTFHNVSFTGTSTVRNVTISGENTFNNLAFRAFSTAVGVPNNTFFSDNQTILGVFSTSLTTPTRRLSFSSTTYGLAITLTINSTPSLTDADFDGIYVSGTAAPISGTRIGNRGECRNINFSTPKTVYWNLAAGGNWTAVAWATSVGGATNINNQPLPQDTAVIGNTGLNSGATITLSYEYIGTIDMSGRTNAMTFSTSTTAFTVYGDWINGSGTTLSGTGVITFSGGGIQSISSASKTFTQPITVDTYGGIVQLSGTALNIGSNTLTITNGTFNTNNLNVTAFSLSSSNSNIRNILLGSSTINLTSSAAPILFSTSTNLTIDPGTSQINISSTASATLSGGGANFYNVTFTGTAAVTHAVTGSNTFNNLTFTAPASAGVIHCTFAESQTISGALTCAGSALTQRISLRSATVGTQITLTAGSISANNCDFRDIVLAGSASGAAPTGAGDCTGNSGITFPSPKTVYWNLAGSQNWSATGWATSSGGTPNANNFPLAQDDAIIDNTSAGSSILINSAWNIGGLNLTKTSGLFSVTTGSNTPFFYGDVLRPLTGVASIFTGVGDTSTITFAGNKTQTYRNNSSATVYNNFQLNKPVGSVFQLGGDLDHSGSTSTFTVVQGVFDAVTYNLKIPNFVSSNSNIRTVKMGTGLWTMSGGFTFLNLATTTNLTFDPGTANILSTSASIAKVFAGGGLYFYKLTNSSSGTLTITGANTFGEFANLPASANSIVFPSSTTTTIGKWSVTGSAGNVVTLSPSTAATAYTISIAGPASTGIDYLSISYCTVATDSPGEFYVGVNSTNTIGNTRVIFTATPAPRTLYWVGGTGNWSSTTKWSTSSGGGSGAAIPTSLDAVNFDSLSNATAYTATIDAGVTLARCASFTMAGPLSGNVTFAGTVGIAYHGNVSFAATGITRTYTGAMQWAGNSSYTFTTNGLTLASACTVIGVGSTWALGFALNIGSSAFTVTLGAFSTSASNYAITASLLSSNNGNTRSINLNGSTLNFSSTGSAINLGTTTNLTFNAGGSQINLSAASVSISSGGLTFNNVSFTSAAATSISISGSNIFNSLSFAGQTTIGIAPITFSGNQTINGTLTTNAGTSGAYRLFLASSTIGTTRTLTVNSFAAGSADVDFRDIAIVGVAAPISGTRFGDCGGNSGITFDAAKTVYWALAGSTSWGSSAIGSWSLTSGGSATGAAFPLAQDTAFFPTATPATGSTVSLNASYNVGTIDMSSRTSNTLTLQVQASTPIIYGDWVNGTGTTLTQVSGALVFSGRSTQNITNAGRSFSIPLTINCPGGSVVLLDNFSAPSANTFTLTRGTFNANGFSFSSGAFSSSGSSTRSIALGSGAWTITGSGSAWNAGTTGLTVSGTATINMNGATAKTFDGGGLSYSDITLNQSGAGALTISGSNTFKDITSTVSLTTSTTISIGGTIQTLAQFTGTGFFGKVLSISGASAVAPGTLILIDGDVRDSDFLRVSFIRAYSLTNTWFAGGNSTLSNFLGWIPTPYPVNYGRFFLMFG